MKTKEEREERKKNRKKFGETKVGIFLKEKFPDLAETALDIAGNFIPGANALKGLFSNTPGISQEDRVAFNEAIMTYEIEIAKINAADTDSARNREIEIAKTDSGWLVKNIVPILAAAWTIFTFVLFILALTGHMEAKENMQFLVINSATNVVMLVVGYYFGSSNGSKMKQDQLNDMSKK